MPQGSPIILDGEPVPAVPRGRALKTPLTDAWGEWISEMGDWHLFGGLTYDQRRRETAPGADVAKRHVIRWLREAPRVLGRPVEAGVVALEYQRNGWPHFHPLLRLAGGMRGGEFAALGQTWFQRHGFARLEEPRSASDVAAYAAKYLVKDLARGDIVLWPLRGPMTTHQAYLGR
jgi:hypothetical protein